MQTNETRNQILSFIQSCGYSPSVRVIATEVGVSISTVQHHLRVLEAQGAIERGPGRRIMVARA